VEKDWERDLFACLIGCIRLGAIEQQDNKRARDTAPTSRNTTIGSASIEVKYRQPTLRCLLKTVGWDDWWLKSQWCPVFFWSRKHTYKDAGRHTIFVCLCTNSRLLRENSYCVGICLLRPSWRTCEDKRWEPVTACLALLSGEKLRTLINFGGGA